MHGSIAEVRKLAYSLCVLPGKWLIQIRKGSKLIDEKTLVLDFHVHRKSGEVECTESIVPH